MRLSDRRKGVDFAQLKAGRWLMLGDLEATALTRAFDAKFLQLLSPRRSQLSRNNPPGEFVSHTRRPSNSNTYPWTIHKKKGPPHGSPSQYFEEGGDQIANTRPFVFRRNAA